MAEFGYANVQARLKEDAVPKFNYSTRGTEPKTMPDHWSKREMQIQKGVSFKFYSLKTIYK